MKKFNVTYICDVCGKEFDNQNDVFKAVAPALVKNRDEY